MRITKNIVSLSIFNANKQWQNTCQLSNAGSRNCVRQSVMEIGVNYFRLQAKRNSKVWVKSWLGTVLGDFLTDVTKIGSNGVFQKNNNK